MNFMRAFILALDRHAGSIQALAAILTVMIAFGALLGVKFQMDSSERLQREQAARDIYREYIALSINRPEFSSPDYCALVGTPQEVAYENFVEYFLYTAEQAIAADPDWEFVLSGGLASHKDYICNINDWSDYTKDIKILVEKFKEQECQIAKKCISAL